MAVYKDGEFHRVQVIYRTLDKFGKIDVKFSSCWTDKRGTHTVPINKSEVDLYCIYCPDTDECYYLDPRKFRSNVSLRVKTPKNSQQKRAKFAADYRRVP